MKTDKPMPEPENVKHELFAQELAKGLGVTEAYVAAGYKNSPASATRLSKKVKNRVKEIRSTTTAIALSELQISTQRVLDELAVVAFFDIRNVFTWEVNDDGETKIRTGSVRSLSSKNISEQAAHAIREIRQGSKGEIRIKMHNKLEALEKIGRYLGMWDDDKKPDPVTQNITNTLIKLESMSEIEKTRRVATWLLEVAQKIKEREKDGAQKHSKDLVDILAVFEGQASEPPAPVDRT
jgi:phage terminase small subunit